MKQSVILLELDIFVLSIVVRVSPLVSGTMGQSLMYASLAPLAESFSASIDVALDKKQFYPDVQLGVDYIATGESANPGVSDSGKDPVMVMFSVDIPMWYGKKRAALAEAEHQYHASIDDLQNSRNQLNADLKMALFEFQDAERKFKLYQTTLTTLARNSLNVARESYEGGRVEFSELIDAQRLLLEFQLSYERARTDHEISLAKIERILGRKLPQPLQMEGSSKL